MPTMSTMYVMRALYIPIGKRVYWVVSGAADTTGQYSGYVITDLSGITTDYTYVAPVNSIGQNATGLNPPSGAATGDLGSTYPNPSVVKLRGIGVSAATPNHGDVMTYNAGVPGWEPSVAPAGFTASGDLTGTPTNQTVSKLQGVALSSPVVADGYILSYNKTSNTINYRPQRAYDPKDYGAIYNDPTKGMENLAAWNRMQTAMINSPEGAGRWSASGKMYVGDTLFVNCAMSAESFSGGQSRFNVSNIICTGNDEGINILPTCAPGSLSGIGLTATLMVNPPLWLALHAYNVGDMVRWPGLNDFYFRCVVAGTTGAIAPGSLVPGDDFVNPSPIGPRRWSPATQYAVGDFIFASRRSPLYAVVGFKVKSANGSTVAGTNGVVGTVEPSWSATPGATVTDGQIVFETHILSDIDPGGPTIWNIVDGTVKWKPETISAIQMNGRFNVDNIFTKGFGCDAVNCYGQLGGYPYTAGNCNGSLISRITVTTGGAGIYVKGFLANSISVTDCYIDQLGVDQGTNQTMPGLGANGYTDHSLLGVVWTNCLCETARGWAFSSSELGASTYIGCYSDGSFAVDRFRNAVIINSAVSNGGKDPAAMAAQLGIINGGGVLNPSTQGDNLGKSKLLASVMPFDGNTVFPIAFERDRFGGDYTGYRRQDYEQGWFIKSSMANNVEIRQLYGFSTNRSPEGRGNRWAPNGEFRGQNKLYHGYDSSFATSKYVRHGARSIGETWVDNPTAAPGEFLSKQIINAGIVASTTWQATHTFSTEDYELGLAADTISPDGVYTFACVKPGPTGASPPTWTGTATGPKAKAWIPNSAVWPGDLFKRTNDGYFNYFEVTRPPLWAAGRKIKPNDTVSPVTANGQPYEVYQAVIPKYPAPASLGEVMIGDIYQPNIQAQYTDGYCLQVLSVIDRGTPYSHKYAHGFTGAEPNWTVVAPNLGDTYTLNYYGDPNYQVTWKVIQLQTGSTEPTQWANSSVVQVSNNIEGVLDNNIFWKRVYWITSGAEPTWVANTVGDKSIDAGNIITGIQLAAVPFTFTYLGDFNPAALVVDGSANWMRIGTTPNIASHTQIVNPGTTTLTGAGTLSISKYTAHYQTIKCTNASTIDFTINHTNGNSYRIQNASSQPLAVLPGSVVIPPGNTFEVYSDGTNLLSENIITPTLPILPSALSGLLVWLRSDQGVTQSGTVSAWADLSGNSNNFTQATAGQRPVYNASDIQYNGLPSFTFDGSNDVLVSGSITMGPFTRILVMRQTVAGYLLEFGGLDYEYGPDPTGLYTTRGGVTSSYNAGTNWGVSSAPRLITHRFDGTHVGNTLRINGVQQSMLTFAGMNGDPGTATFTHTMGLFGGSGGTGATAAGTVAEVIIFNRALTTAETLRIEAYLQSRYLLY